MRVVLDGDQPPARFAQPHADPDRAVAAGRADFQRLLRAVGRDQQAKEAAVFCGNRQLARIRLPDVVEHRLNLRGQARRGRVGRGAACGGHVRTDETTSEARMSVSSFMCVEIA